MTCGGLRLAAAVPAVPVTAGAAATVPAGFGSPGAARLGVWLGSVAAAGIIWLAGIAAGAPGGGTAARPGGPGARERVARARAGGGRGQDAAFGRLPPGTVAPALEGVDHELERLARQCHTLHEEADVEAHRTTLRSADGTMLRV
jgi:hypothetical protein